MKRGDMSAYLGPQIGIDALGRTVFQGAIYDPMTTRTVTAGQVDPATGLTASADATIRDPFPGNIIPSNRFDRVAKNILPLFPAPSLPRVLSNFGSTDAPITMVVLMEFSSRAYGWFSYYAKYWADALFPNLKQKDWVALVTFDMKPRLEVDFTQNKDEVRNAIYHLYFPGFSESNLFDKEADGLWKRLSPATRGISVGLPAGLAFLAR